jgi:hypothetical protein
MSTHIAMYRGDDATFPFTLTRDGVAVDLTTATVTFTARKTLADVAPTITVTPVTLLPNQTTTDKGKVEVTIPAASTIALAPGLLFCDIEVTDGDVWTWPEPEYGQSTLIRLRIKADVTHA